MRLVRVKCPEGIGPDVAKLAFTSGIDRVSQQQVVVTRADHRETFNDVIDVETSTPKAKIFIDKLMQAPFFDAKEFAISVRQPRSIISGEELAAVTKPLPEPAIDLFEELWQFSQVTYDFIGRILIGGVLLAYGMVEFKLLFIIAGLLFIPLLPLMLAIGFGVCTGQFRLAGQGLVALAVALILLATGGVVVALLTNPPMRFTESNSLASGLLLSLAVGVAAALATVDDSGRREMIGLAASSQVAIIPVWLGICLVFGVPATEIMPPGKRALSLGLNILAIAVASVVTYTALRMKSSTLKPLRKV